MLRIRCWVVVGILLSLMSGISGCKMFSLLPSTTWKLNRGPALDEGPGYFSVADPVAATAE